MWHSSITVGEELELGRVQKVALRLISKEDLSSYEAALVMKNLETLKSRTFVSEICQEMCKK